VKSLADTAAILLAAGAGSRFRGNSHKLLADLGGVPVYQRALTAMMSAGFGHVIVVTGAIDLWLPAEVIQVDNPDWSKGQMTSLRAGIDMAKLLTAQAVVIGLGDQPFLTSQSWRAVGINQSPIAVATYGAHRGHPVRLARQVWEKLDDAGDQGARSLMRSAPDLVVEVPCEGSTADIDTVEDLQQWNLSMNSSSIARSKKPGRSSLT
jgi:molybdenum cofactor cytidylyltransferase